MTIRPPDLGLMNTNTTNCGFLGFWSFLQGVPHLKEYILGINSDMVKFFGGLPVKTKSV
jgi:hypothetical protein